MFMAVEVLFNICIPTISYALTSGPTAPEATSFEPVDTTDMVNLLTGDLAYNIPLLEVPGPAGGYPLSLSYHAGIQPNEDASWAGLGWTLNPGAIARNVNGFADDQFNASNMDRVFWEGGTTDTYNIGVSVGVYGNVGSVGAGLSFSQDTYEGFGVGGHIRGGVQLGGSDSPLGISGELGVSPYGGAYGSAGITARTSKGISLSSTVGISTNFKKVSGFAGGGVSYSPGGSNMLGASLMTSRNGISSSLSVGGGSTNGNNGKSGSVSTQSSGFGVSLPVFPAVWLNLGYRQERYWIDELENIKVNGALNSPDQIPDLEWMNDHAYDSYTIDEYSLHPGEAKFLESFKQSGGSFPNYDDYSVNAQGISGSIRPHAFQSHLYRQNVKHFEGEDEVYEAIQYPTGINSTPIEFRFINDFSNQYQYTPSNSFKLDGEEKLTYDFEEGSEIITGENGDDGLVGGHLMGSRHIDYLTNLQIINQDDNDNKFQRSGFLETKSAGFNRGELVMEQIGAFVITNESGVKYHFGLPAYSFDEYQYSENIDKEDGLSFNSIKKPERYAYTWYLTAITGPDFVDRGEIGILDQADWGYWVEFDYGKWTDSFSWRNPSEGFIQDLDNNFQNYSSGVKEIYYLDAVKTKTHTALFVKELRKDGKGVSSSLNGGFSPKIDYGRSCNVQFPVSVLGLKEILLLKNENIPRENYLPLKQSGLEMNFGFQYQCSWQDCSYDDEYEEQCEDDYDQGVFFAPHFGDNILDVSDSELTELKNISIRSINLLTDYSLAPLTANSMSNEDLYKADPDINRSGKYTLKALEFLGKKGHNLMPPTSFDYDLTSPISGNGTLTVLNRDNNEYEFSHSNSKLIEGDILKISKEQGTYYALVEQIDGDIHSLTMIDKKPFSSGSIQWRQTKNPPYEKNHYDNWGLYKSDYEEPEEINNDVVRYRSELSKESVDVWSLRTITTTLGSEIGLDYQSDHYKESVFNSPLSIPIKNVIPLSNNKCRIVTERGGRLTVNQYANLKLALINIGQKTGFQINAFYDHHSINDVQVVSHSNGEVVIENQQLFELMTQIKSKESVSDGEITYLESPYVLAGHISSGNDENYTGGGLLVNSVSISSVLGKSTNLIEYAYSENGNSTGVTS